MTTPADQPDMVTWLRAQLDDDEQVARAAADHGDVWRAGSGKTVIYPSDESRHPGPIIIGPYGDLEEQHTDHIVRHDPARVLADVDATRLRLDLIAELATRDPDTALRFAKAEALPYADRPGYQERWRP